MPSTTDWKDIRAKRTKLEAAFVARERQLMRLEGQLLAWREQTGLSQRAVAERLNVSQANVSRIEHEDDLRLSTLAGYVAALGGELEIRAVFDGGATVISASTGDRDPSP